MKYILSILLSMVMVSQALSEMLITHVTPLNSDDRRHDYEIALLRLSLEKTIDDFGPYTMAGAAKMNQARSKASVRQNRYTNLIRTFGYEKDFERDYDVTYIPFPIHLGLVGYRVCFIPESLQQPLNNVKTSDDLLQFLHGQGKSWADVAILRHNGFKVTEIAEYESLFKMTAAGRIHLFCRGVNEVMYEYKNYKDMKGLALDRAMIIFYPMPRFYYIHKSNSKAAQRIEVGLKRAYKDGSMTALWEKNYRESIDFVKLERRRFFYFDSPNTNSINFDYTKYFVQLEKDKSNKQLDNPS